MNGHTININLYKQLIIKTIENLTNKQVSEQLNRYNKLVKNYNLIGLGESIVKLMQLDYNALNHVHLCNKILNDNKISPTMYIPTYLEKNQNMFYNENLMFLSITAYIDSIKTQSTAKENQLQ